MKIRKAFAIVVFQFFVALTSHSYSFDPGIPFIRYYSTREYDGGIQNWSIAQHNTGLIYVANNFGVLEYDGSAWKRYAPASGTKVRHIAIDPSGKIYVASQGDFGYLFPNESGSLQYTSLADSLEEKYRSFDETWRVFIDHERIFFCTFQEIFIFNGDGSIEVIEPKYAPENFFYSNHQLYVNQLEIGLSYLDGKVLKLLQGGEDLKGMTITSIINLPNNELWISTLDQGIFIYDGTSFKPWAVATTLDIREAAINNAIRLKNGNYAIGTHSSGVFILSPDGEVIMHLDKSKGLNNRTVLSLFEDVQNNLWLGHNNGISFIELGMPFTYINEQAGLPGTGYTGYLDGEKLYLGTNNGIFVKEMDDQSSFDYKYIENTEGQVYSINKYNGQLLIGHHHGAFRLNGNNAIKISDILGAWTFLQLKDKPEYIIEGTYKGLLLHKIINGEIVYQHKIRGFYESSRVMEQDQQGNIWMTHGYKGVYKLSLNEEMDSVHTVHHFGIEHGLPSNLLINVFRIRNQLVFTTQNGIFNFDESIQKFVPDKFFEDFFKNDPVIALAEDPFQNIYYLTQNDIGVLEKNARGSYEQKNSVFNKLKDMLNDDLQNISILSANRVLYGAKEGFILYNAGNTQPVDLSVPMLIRNVRTTNDSTMDLFSGFFLDQGKIINNQPKNNILKLPYDKNSLQFVYSAPFIDGLDKTQYQYWLENNETGWSEWTVRADKEYTNLKEGDYTFHVRAKNIYGTQSDIASYTFTILPPWYRSGWAYGGYSLSVLSLLFASFYLFDKKHKNEKNIMSIKQQKELHIKEKELQNIARESATEIERLKNEKLLAEIESKNKELATSTMHLINKNSFITGMKTNLVNISKKSKSQELKIELKKIVGNIEKNISQDDDWEHFSLHFDQVHGNFTTRLKEVYPDLSPQEMKLAAYLRMNLSTKEMAHLLNISIRGVEICRYRLRKKLDLKRPANLQEYILKF